MFLLPYPGAQSVPLVTVDLLSPNPYRSSGVSRLPPLPLRFAKILAFQPGTMRPLFPLLLPLAIMSFAAELLLASL